MTLPRRHFLHHCSLATLAFPVVAKAAETPAATPSPTVPFRNLGIYQFHVGSLTAYAILAGHLEAHFSQPFFAPEASPEEFRAAVDLYTDQGRILMPYNVLLLETGEGLVLVDAGPGEEKDRPCPVVAALKVLGYGPEAVSRVVLTHAHFDHMGGLLDARGERVFVKARHQCLRAEKHFWTAPSPDFSQLRMSGEHMARQARRVFETIPFDLLEEGDEILPGLQACAAPGHTPGHMILRLSSNGQSLCFISDLCHESQLFMHHPGWSVGSDIDSRLAVATRLRLFEELSGNQTRVMGFHLPFPGLGKIKGGQGRYHWLQEPWRS